MYLASPISFAGSPPNIASAPITTPLTRKQQVANRLSALTLPTFSASTSAQRNADRLHRLQQFSSNRPRQVVQRIIPNDLIGLVPALYLAQFFRF